MSYQNVDHWYKEHDMIRKLKRDLNDHAKLLNGGIKSKSIDYD